MTQAQHLSIYVLAFKKASDYLLENSSSEQKEEFYKLLKHHIQTINCPLDVHLLDELDDVMDILSPNRINTTN